MGAHRVIDSGRPAGMGTGAGREAIIDRVEQNAVNAHELFLQIIPIIASKKEAATVPIPHWPRDEYRGAYYQDI